MPDPWTAAWEEAEASAPPGVDKYVTLELQHPAFVDDGTPFAVRAVAGSNEEENFTLEADASINAGEEVTFKPIPFYAERPEYEEGKTPSCDIIVDNVERELMPYLEEAVVMRANMIAIYREYRSDDRTAPCYGPVQFTIKMVTVSNTQIKGTAMIDDLANRKFPNKVFSIFKFPALQQ